MKSSRRAKESEKLHPLDPPDRSQDSGPTPDCSLPHPALHLECSGEWMPAADLKKAALEALAQNKDLVFSLAGLSHLDALALQILLAVQKQQQESGLRLYLVDVSSELMRWFEVGGAQAHFTFNSCDGGPSK